MPVPFGEKRKKLSLIHKYMMIYYRAKIKKKKEIICIK